VLSLERCSTLTSLRSFTLRWALTCSLPYVPKSSHTVLSLEMCITFPSFRNQDPVLSLERCNTLPSLRSPIHRVELRHVHYSIPYSAKEVPYSVELRKVWYFTKTKKSHSAVSSVHKCSRLPRIKIQYPVLCWAQKGAVTYWVAEVENCVGSQRWTTFTQP
jgi:hypothetical protein